MSDTPMTDQDFREFVLRHRAYGFGRMMDAISELWRQSDSNARSMWYAA